MTRIVVFLAAVSTAAAVCAETAALRIVWGTADSPQRVETRQLELERLGDAQCRAVVPKDEIPPDADFVEIVPSFMTAKKGDAGWMEGDGVEDPFVALKIVEFGGRPIFYTYRFADVPRIRKAWDEFVPIRHLQRELMVSHREIAPDVFETRYANGAATVCNYGTSPFFFEGEKVAPMGYALFENGAATCKAAFQ